MKSVQPRTGSEAPDLVSRRVGALLFLWTLLPLPFLYVVLPPFWILAALIALWCVFDTERHWVPSNTVLNALAVIILMLVLGAGGFRIGPLRPLGHLLLLLTALKVAQLGCLKDLRRVLAPVFLVQIIDLASAVHVSVVPYLIASVALWWFVGMSVFLRGIAIDSALVGADRGREGEEVWLWPKWSHVIPAALLSLLLGVPVFLVFPRLSSPLIAMEGRARQGGFSTHVELDRSGLILESPDPVMRLETSDGRPVEEKWLRLRGTVCQQVFGGVWRAPTTGLQPVLRHEGKTWMDGVEDLSGCIEVKIFPEKPERYLFLPPGTRAVATDDELLIDTSGGLRHLSPSDESASYRVWFRDPPPPKFDPPGPQDLMVSGESRRMVELSRKLAREGRNDEERAFALVDELQRRCRYSLSTHGVPRGYPLDWFLFEGRQGHCEYFAAAMVSLLRLEKIPARFVVGFHGASRLEEDWKVVIRASNAHAWVEAWMGPGKGWVVFDPTPSEGVDSLEQLSWWKRFQMSWGKLESFYDRKILSFGLKEQFQIISLGADWWHQIRVAARNIPLRHVLIPPALLGLFLLGLRCRRKKLSWKTPARRRLSRIEGYLKREGVLLPPTTSWNQLAGRASERWPVVGSEIHRLAEMAEEEAYALLSSPHRREIVQLWKKIRRELRRAAL